MSTMIALCPPADLAHLSVLGRCKHPVRRDVGRIVPFIRARRVSTDAAHRQCHAAAVSSQSMRYLQTVDGFNCSLRDDAGALPIGFGQHTANFPPA